MSDYQNSLGKVGAFLDTLINTDHVPRDIAMQLDQRLRQVTGAIDTLAARAKTAKKVSELAPYIETLTATVKDLQR